MQVYILIIGEAANELIISKERKNAAWNIS